MDFGVNDTVDHFAKRTPGSVALVSADTGHQTTWRELDARVSRLSGALYHRFGVRKGDRVSALSENDPRTFELQFACMRLGALFAPLNWRLTAPELIDLCADAEPKVLFHDGTWATLAGEVAEGAEIGGRAGWDAGGISEDYESLLTGATAIRAGRDHDLSDATHVLYTSGTTGRPKGALSTFLTLLWNALNITQVNLLRGADSRLFLPLPLFHAGGLNTLANPILLQGGSVVVARRFDPEQALRALGDPSLRVTHFGSIPTMWQMMMDQPGWSEADFSSLVHAQCAGGLVSDDMASQLHEIGITLQVQYGGTEMGPNVTAMPRGSATSKPGSCGMAVPYSQVRIVDPDGNDVQPGQRGEVWISGPSVTPGYFRRNRQDDRAFFGRYFRTGDAAYADEEGFFYLVDRIKEMYKSGGENVYPAEVERVLIEHPAVAEVVVIAVPDDKWGEVGRAVVVVRPGQSITLAELNSWAGTQLARFKQPKSLVLTDVFPRNATGKVNRADMRRLYGKVSE